MAKKKSRSKPPARKQGSKPAPVSKGQAPAPGAKKQQGLYYYYTAFAKSMAAFGEAKVIDGQGNEHNWRNELVAKLIELQHEKGYWVNKQTRWWEGLKDLTTARAVIALSLATRPSE